MGNRQDNFRGPDLPEVMETGYGAHYIVANNDRYCGKILRFRKGKKCSWHYHRVKDETFLLLSGKLILRYGTDDDITAAQEVILRRGERFHVPPGLRHQMEALEDSDLAEFSTTHFEEDSIRIIRGD